MTTSPTTLRLGIIQRVLTTYRRPFFEKLTSQSDIELSVFAGQPQHGEAIHIEEAISQGQIFSAINRHWQSPVGQLCWQSGLRRWLRSFDPQVLVIEANPRILSHWLVIKWMHQRRRPVLGWGLGELERSGPLWFQKARRRFAWSIVRSFDAMIAYSSKARSDYISAGVPADRIFVAHNSIDNTEAEKYLSQLGADLTWVHQWKKSHILNPYLPVILFVGRLIPQKRVALLIQACAPILDKCQLVIVGDGPSRRDLEYQASVLKGRVCFLGHQSGEMLARLFIASDIFVLPGAGGLAVHQAMSYGKPVIVSFGDGTEIDLVREGQNGFFFRAADADDLRAKILILLGDLNKIRQFGQASLDIIRSEINLDEMVKRFQQAIDYVLLHQ